MRAIPARQQRYGYFDSFITECFYECFFPLSDKAFSSSSTYNSHSKKHYILVVKLAIKLRAGSAAVCQEKLGFAKYKPNVCIFMTF